MMRVLSLVIVVYVIKCSAMSKDELEDFSNFLLKTSQLDLHVKSADPGVNYDEVDVVSDHAWEDSGKFEGDLILNDRQRRLIVETVEGLSRNGLKDSTKRWPDNEVIYFIQREHFSSGQVQAILAGIEDLAQASCVRFRPYRKGDRDAVVIQGSRRGCFSQVGYQGGYQVLNLSGRHPVGRGCFRHGTVVHELLHTLGFYHMQSSPDRDDYIDVVWSNIVQPARHNFRKYNSFAVSDFGVGYDYDSVLHYSRKAFSSNGQDTLVPKQRGVEIGQRVGLSDKDTQKLNKMYCDADNDRVQADQNTDQKPKKKKKKPKNQPFDGHGIGYHQGKTLVIKLPVAKTYKLSNVPPNRVFDFSKPPQVVPTPKAKGYRLEKKVVYLYKPIITLNKEAVTELNKRLEKEVKQNNDINEHNSGNDGKLELTKENKHLSSQRSKDLDKLKPVYVPIDIYDKDIQDAFDRVKKIVKQHVYPNQHKGDAPKIDKDYSKFFTPLKSKNSYTIPDPFSNKIKEPLSDSPLKATTQKQVDDKESKIELTENPHDKQLTPPQFEDRMDSTFETSLPTKKPYSYYEQTETPQYATLEYLKGRHDFSNIYSPKSLEDGKLKESYTEYKDEVTPSKLVKSDENYLKIIPPRYGERYYTDYLKEHSLTGTSKEQISEDIKPSKLKVIENPINEQSGAELQMEDRMDSSFRTLFPTKKPYSAYENTETPKYATLEYLKNRHDFSNLYSPKTSDDEKRNGHYTILKEETPPTEGDWYKNEAYKKHPANYVRDSYSDYVRENTRGNEQYESDKDNSRITDSRNDSQDDTSAEAPERTETKYKYPYDDPKSYENYKKEKENLKEDSGEHANESKEELNENQDEEDDEKYYIHDESERDDRTQEATDDYDSENDKATPNKGEINDRSEKNDAIFYTDPENGTSGRLTNLSNENEDTNNKDTKKSKVHSLYGDIVPLSDDWFKPHYSIPDIPHIEEKAKSQDVTNR